jgi:hypothetical protein
MVTLCGRLTSGRKADDGDKFGKQWAPLLPAQGFRQGPKFCLLSLGQLGPSKLLQLTACFSCLKRLPAKFTLH